MASKQGSGAGCGLVIVLVIVACIVGGIVNLVGGGTSDTSTTDTPDYSTYVPDPASDVPVVPDSTDPGSDGGSVNHPGNGYITGPGVDCGFGGCHAHVLPHFGFHF